MGVIYVLIILTVLYFFLDIEDDKPVRKRNHKESFTPREVISGGFRFIIMGLQFAISGGIFVVKETFFFIKRIYSRRRFYTRSFSLLIDRMTA